MTIKKFSIIAGASILLLAGAIGISMHLTRPQEMELTVDEAQEELVGDLPQTLENMENMPLYYNDRDLLLLPLRNVIEGLGGTVNWDAEKRMTEISYHGKKLLLAPGETEAFLNGYEITLPVAAEMINGCLYAEEAVLTAYYTGDVVWDTNSEQIILQAKDHTIPVVAKKTLTGEANGRRYEIELPVLVGLNDANFEKSLNESIREELTERSEAFLVDMDADAVAEPADANLQLTLHTGWISAEFISLWWEGSQSAEPLYLTKNIDLLGQKTVSQADLLEESVMQQMHEIGGAGDPIFYLDTDGTAVLLAADAEGHLTEERLQKENLSAAWKKAYRGIFNAAE